MEKEVIKLPKKLLKNYILFDITKAFEVSSEEEDGITPLDDTESKKLGAVIMVGTNVIDIKVGDRVLIPDSPHVNPIIFKHEGKELVAFREADVIAIL